MSSELECKVIIFELDAKVVVGDLKKSSCFNSDYD